jgi:exonuclease III
MPFYSGLKEQDRRTRRRTVDSLLALRAQLAKEVPTRTGEDTLLLATWNIREFDSAKYGPRVRESLYLIAEILDHFDLVAVQEVHADLQALKEVMALLGKWWHFVFTDVTYGRAGANERMAMLYDTRKVEFSGLAGEVVIPGNKGGVVQLARTPFVCGFKCSWIAFDLCTVHTYYGSAKPNEPRRLKEIKGLTATLASRSDAGDTPNIILLGDFNIFSRRDKTYKALLDGGFTVPLQLTNLKRGSNIKQDKEYDQIAFMERKRRFIVRRAGIFNFYKSVFRDGDEAIWKPVMAGANKYKDWRTYQMSDHLPMWVELAINHTENYLKYLRTWTSKTPSWSHGPGSAPGTRRPIRARKAVKKRHPVT